MKQEEYVKTIVVYGKMVNVGMDDYGQQYFLEYIDEDGNLAEVGCGAYNTNYEDVAKGIIDHRRWSIEFWGEETYLEMERQKELRNNRLKTQEIPTK